MPLGTIIFWGVLRQNTPPYSPGPGAEEFAAQILDHAAKARTAMIRQMPISVLLIQHLPYFGEYHAICVANAAPLDTLP